MVTFDGNIATKESQVFIEQEKLRIISGRGSEEQKARQLEALYNQYGLVYGTYRRINQVSYDRDNENTRFAVSPSDSDGEFVGYIWLAGIIGLIFMLGWIDSYLKEQGIHFSFLKTIFGSIEYIGLWIFDIFK